MTTVYDILDQLAADNSRLAKEAILTSNKDNADLKEAFRIALDPLISYYIRKIPAYTKQAKSKKSLSWAMQELLNEFATRNVTGNAAIEHLTFVLESVNEKDASVVERIIKQDLRCGVSEATANKIWPKLISTYPVMLASGFDQKLVDKIKFPAYCQLKLDGMRFNAIVRNGTVEYRSRNGKELNIPSKLFSSALLKLASYYGANYVFDGELLVVDSAGKPLDRKTGNGILSKAVKGTMSDKEAAMVRVTLWDAIPFTGFQAGVYKTPYNERFMELMQNVDFLKGISAIGHLVDIVWTKEVNTQLEAQNIFEKFLADGQEGTILKSKTNIWEDKRSKEQIKFKGELECDLVVVGWEEGTGKNQGRLGALVCESSDGLIQVNVGSGYSDEQRKEFTKTAAIGKIVTVKYNARIKDRGDGVERLFLPTFIEMREDKDVADSSKKIK
jgi:ATP-dependent DNA ligase